MAVLVVVLLTIIQLGQLVVKELELNHNNQANLDNHNMVSETLAAPMDKSMQAPLPTVLVVAAVLALLVGMAAQILAMVELVNNMISLVLKYTTLVADVVKVTMTMVPALVAKGEVVQTQAVQLSLEKQIEAAVVREELGTLNTQALALMQGQAVLVSSLLNTNPKQNSKKTEGI